MIPTESISARFSLLAPYLNERQRRLWAAAEVKALGRGGSSAVAKALGMSRITIREGLRELENPGAVVPVERVRKEGAGRKKATEKDPGLDQALDQLVEPVIRGDPESPLRWVATSLEYLATTLTQQGHPVSAQTVCTMLHEKGYSLQANKKTDEGKQHPDRNGQFEYIYKEVSAFQARNQPVISVDAKKKELVGPYRNAGQTWRPKGLPEEVNVYDFIGDLGKATPYGAYDMTHNEGWVSVGTDHDTAAFAVESIRTWWERMGKARYPEAKELLITADGGGSNGSRNRLWKHELGKLAQDIGLQITVSHLPPGTSKWNKIEHRMFAHISMNWRGTPLTDHEVIVGLIGATTTKTGLKIGCDLDPAAYECGIKVTEEEMAALNLRRHDFHGEWNYTVAPIGQVIFL